MPMRLMKDEEGVSEVFGYIIILGIAITGLALLLLLATSSIQNTKDNGQIKEVGQAFTVVDSRLSKARFSTSIFQEAPFKVNDGTIIVDESAGHITVKDGNDVLYDEDFGTIKCITDTGEIAYQDGGVWVKFPDGGTTMLSPPDFDYNGVTLTLPILKITGDEVTSYSNNIALVDSLAQSDVTVEFPGDTTGTNPIAPGKLITITVQSDYYKGWESYFKERVSDLTPITTNDNDKTVTVTLSSGIGKQVRTSEDPYFDTKYMDTSYTEPIEIFYFSMDPKGKGNAYGIYFDTYSTLTKDPRLQISTTRTTAHLNKEYAEVVFTYTSGSYTEEFRGLIAYQRKSDDKYALDLLDTNTVPDEDDSTSPSTIYDVLIYDADQPSISWGADPYASDLGSEVNPGDIKSAYDVTQHYMWLLANAYQDSTAFGENWGPKYEKTKDRYLNPSTNYILQYKSNEQIKYLYITEGALDTSLASRG
jgi:hypothetical protein